MKPFAIQLYERFIGGESPEHLAAALNIPVGRVVARLLAAERHLQQRAGRHEGRGGAEMSNETQKRLVEGAVILESGGTKARQREIVEQELRDLEQDILADPGALAALLVSVRRRTRRNKPER